MREQIFKNAFHRVQEPMCRKSGKEGKMDGSRPAGKTKSKEGNPQRVDAGTDVLGII